MAMKPFCGYNFADYWAHWLSFDERSEKLPKIFHVNWFRQDKSGHFLWPGQPHQKPTQRDLGPSGREGGEARKAVALPSQLRRRHG